MGNVINFYTANKTLEDQKISPIISNYVRYDTKINNGFIIKANLYISI